MRFHVHCRTLSLIEHCHMKQKETLRQEQDICDGELHKSPSRHQACAHFADHLAPPKSSNPSKGPVGRMIIGRHRLSASARQVGCDNTIANPSSGLLLTPGLCVRFQKDPDTIQARSSEINADQEFVPRSFSQRKKKSSISLPCAVLADPPAPSDNATLC